MIHDDNNPWTMIHRDDRRGLCGVLEPATLAFLRLGRIGHTPDVPVERRQSRRRHHRYHEHGNRWDNHALEPPQLLQEVSALIVPATKARFYKDFPKRTYYSRFADCESSAKRKFAKR